MKICFVLIEYNLSNMPTNSSGVGIFYSNLTKLLKSKGYEVDVLVFPTYYMVIRDIIKYGEEFKQPSNILDNWDEYIFYDNDIYVRYILNEHESHFCSNYYKAVNQYLSQWLRDYPVDIIEATEGGGYLQYCEFNFPLVVRLHNGYTVMNEILSQQIDDTIKLAENIVLMNADSIAPVSKHILDATILYNNWFADNVYKIIYNGVDTQALPYQNIANIDNNLNSKKISYIGSITFDKGIDKLLKWFNIVNRQDANIELILVGRGNFNEFSSLLTKQAYKKVTYLGSVSHTEIPSLIEDSHLIVSFSHIEACPLIVLESMSVGRPVMAFSECKSFQEIIEHDVDGILWDDLNNIEGAAKEAVRLLNNPKKIEFMGFSARQKIEKKFNNNRFIDETLAWYSDVINNFQIIRESNQYKVKQYYKSLLIDTYHTNYIYIRKDIGFIKQIHTSIKYSLKDKGFNKGNIISIKLIRWLIKEMFIFIKSLFSFFRKKGAKK